MKTQPVYSQVLRWPPSGGTYPRRTYPSFSRYPAGQQLENRGSPSQYSGFDLDAIKISTTFASTAAQASAATGLNLFDFNPTGTVFTPGTQRSPVNPKLNGPDASGLNVDPSFATLGTFDAIFFGTGSVTLGDGGRSPSI